MSGSDHADPVDAELNPAPWAAVSQIKRVGTDALTDWKPGPCFDGS
ncbi:hypothetical protein ABZV93_00865 [Actinopolymorpha sp. NPDC004070]